MIDKKIIKQRKEVYGSNFENTCQLWNEYFKECGILNKEITPKDVAVSLALLKQTRIETIKEKLQELKKDKEFDSIRVQLTIKKLNEALEDSKKDYANYLWISENFEEYERL